MRIAILSWESLHSVAVGGVAVHVTELAAGMARRGHEVHVVTRMAPGQRFHDLIDGVHYHRCPYSGHSEFVDEVNNMCRAMVDRVFIIEDMMGAPLDVVHAHDWLTSNAMIWIKRGRGRRVVLTVHSTEYGRCGNAFHGGRSQRIRDQERAGAYWADHIVTVSQAVKNEISWMYEVPHWKTSVIYNGANPRQYDGFVDPGGTKQVHGIGPLDPVVLFCGRMEWQKGPDLLVEAIPATLRTHPSTKFVFAGDGHMRSQLEHRSRQLGVAHAARFLGRRGGSELTNLYKMCETVCVPSRNEPFGIVVLEAWSARKPVVVTQVGGPNEYVTHEVNGLKIYPHPGSVVWGLGQMFANFDRARWMGQNGRYAVEARFTWDKIVGETLAVYDPAPVGLEGVRPAPASTEASRVRTVVAVPSAAGAEQVVGRGNAPASARAVPSAAGAEAAGGADSDELRVLARLSFRAAGGREAAEPAFAECRRILARSGLRVHLRRRSALVQGDWESVTAAVRECCRIVSRTGIGRIVASIKPAATGAVAEGALAPDEALYVAAPRLVEPGGKIRRHRVSVA